MTKPPQWNKHYTKRLAEAISAYNPFGTQVYHWDEILRAPFSHDQVALAEAIQEAKQAFQEFLEPTADTQEKVRGKEASEAIDFKLAWSASNLETAIHFLEAFLEQKLKQSNPTQGTEETAS